jgi:DNA-binding MarR family transcriptional regulator/DNA-binding CsgD family transcriptional regulator
MIHHAELLEPAEIEVYRALMRASPARAIDVAEASGMEVGLAARLLESLRGKGLTAAGPGPDPAFRPLPPDVALGDVLVRQQESLEDARRAVARLSEEFHATARRRDADRLVEIVVGAKALRERLRDLQNSARHEILWFCKANPLAMSGPENAEESAALQRGVRYRAIYERALLDDPAELASIVEGVGWGEHARTLPTLPVRLAIADAAVAICPLVPDGERGISEPTAALVRRSELLDALLALFEGHWDRATPIAVGEEGTGAPAESERLLLSLFVAGLPDKAIASQLGVSRRTVQRRLDRLMATAGVDTRTGLAFQAARQGWL